MAYQHQYKNTRCLVWLVKDYFGFPDGEYFSFKTDYYYPTFGDCLSNVIKPAIEADIKKNVCKAKGIHPEALRFWERDYNPSDCTLYARVWRGSKNHRALMEYGFKEVRE